MSKDIVLTGAIIGILADAVKLMANYILFLLNYSNVVFWQIAASRFLDKNDLFQPAAYLIGAIADITITAVLGVLFVIMIYLTGTRYLWIKGIGFGLFVWVGLFGTLLGQSVQAKLPQDPSGIMVTIAAHFIFGLSLAVFSQFLYQVKKETSENEVAKNHFVPMPARKVLFSDLQHSEKERNEKTNTKKHFKLGDLLRIRFVKGRKRC